MSLYKNAGSHDYRIRHTNGETVIGPESFRPYGPIVEDPIAVQVPTNGSTIDTSVAGVIPVNPAAAVTGVILEAGTVDGQMITIVNRAAGANSVTFAAAGTSNVADGTSSVIAGLTARRYVWDSTAARWFPCK
jgi:hypothetical protein